MPGPSDTTPPNYRWNFLAFVVDYVFFGVAISFVRPDSVLPAFIRQFTRSAPVIGLVSTVWNGCWLLPQVVSARWINDKPRKKPYLMVGMSGRVAFWVIGLALWLGLGRNPEATLLLFFVCLGLFTITDGLASVAWFDMLARAIPVERRGRLIGVAQIVSGLAGLGVGWVITHILGSARFSFPTDYALIFTLAGVAFIPSTLALILLRESQAEQEEASRDRRPHNGWITPLLHDRTFRRLMGCRVLVGMISLVTPFYVVHATDVLNLSQAIVGSFVAAQQAAGVAAGALLGWVSDRWGPSRSIGIGSAVSIVGPLFALVAHVADGDLIVRAYPLVYVALGVYQSSTMLGFYNYLLEIAPDDVRPSYIGLGNTILGVLTLAPTVGGWLLEATSYTALFAITVGLALLGFLLAMRLDPVPQTVAPPAVKGQEHA
ncbi:MAG: MFS transporter [Anaerolineae bacterium]|jgi:MFS family permease